MVAGAMRRACFVAVLRCEEQLAYLLDVEELSARVGSHRRERTP
jgi:hypothetical protein